MFHKGLIENITKQSKNLEPSIDEIQLNLHRYLIYEYHGASKDENDKQQYNFKIIRPKLKLTTESTFDDYESAPGKRKRNA